MANDRPPNEDVPLKESPPTPAEKRAGMIATGLIVTVALAAAVYWMS